MVFSSQLKAQTDPFLLGMTLGGDMDYGEISKVVT
jgi:hypothetical protein